MLNLNRGVIVPVITPYHHAEIISVIDHIMQGGVTSIFLLGTTGQCMLQEHQAKKDLIKRVADHVRDKMQLITGISAQHIQQSQELMETAAAAGVTASVIAPLAMSDDADLVIRTLLSSCPGNLLLYNPPNLPKGRVIPHNLIQSYLSEERILGIKDSSCDMDYFKQLIAIRGNQHRFKIYYGPEKHLEEMIKLEIDGFVPSSGNLYPELACRLWLEKSQGPWAEWNIAKEKIDAEHENHLAGIKAQLFAWGLISDAR